jgi:phage major head subunit gpT-like protein
MLPFDLNIIERGIRGLFAREFLTRQRKAKHPMFTTVVQSDKQEEKYNTISTLPQLREVTDERVLSGFSEYSYTLKNKVYSTGIKVPRTLFEFDQTAQLRTLVQSLGARVANFPDKLLYSVMGANPTCYDGQSFFSATHDMGDGNAQVNTLTGQFTNSTITGATSKTNRDDLIARFQLDLIAAKAQLLLLKDDRGEPWHETAEPESLLILCHPRVEFYVRTALEAALVSDTGNVTLKSVRGLITTNYETPFTDSGPTLRYGTWYLMKTDTPIMPFIFQRFGPKMDFQDPIPEADQAVLQALNSVEIQTVMRTGQMIDAHTFFDDEFLFGARVIYSAGVGMWNNIIRVTAADWS